MSARPATAKVFTVPASVSLVDALAESLRAQAGEDPLALAHYRILLPNRRSLRLLREAFLRSGNGKPLALPRMSAIGDVEEDELLLFGAPEDLLALPPAIPEARRLFLLTRLIRDWRGPGGQQPSPAAALRLARELARLIDAVHTADVSFDRLAELVPESYAAHWRRTLDFLRIVTEHWPAILAEEGALDPADQRNRLLRALARRWREAPPPGPVIAAGSTGSIPATADLLGVIARLPEGAVILPGLDTGMESESWDKVGPSHPQFMMKQLLARIGVARDEVEPWPLPARWREKAARLSPRTRLFAEALRPAETVERWRDFRVEPAPALAGVRRIDCPGLREEAGAIALLMREALETPGKTAALVTPDRALARMVRAELRRWQVEVDDSAGSPVAASPPGAFLRLLCRTLAEGLRPVGLLALLKHPLTAGGRTPGAVRDLARRIDRFEGNANSALRGPATAPGMAPLLDALGKAGVPSGWIAELKDVLAPLTGLEALLRGGGDCPLSELLARHIEAAEAVAATNEETGGERLWSGEAGEALAVLLAEARASADILGKTDPAAYP
ncbi:MAG: double-strand break repair protein AddB, partial [Alphaproteobacteria bacterium]